MTEGKNKRINALKNAAKEKRRRCAELTDKAIRKLISTNKPLSIAKVSREAGVSASYIYKYPELKERILSLRSKQTFKPTTNQKASENSKNIIIYNLKDEIKRLRQEMVEFKRTNQILVGKIYDYQNSQSEIERLKANNKKQSELILQLQLKLDKTQKELEACPNTIMEANPKVISLTEKIENTNKKIHVDDEIKNKLSPIVTRLTSSLIKTIESKNSKQEIINAISAVEEYLATSKKVKSKTGLLRKAIEENWMPNCTDEERKINQVTDDFSKWFKLAKEQGIVQASQGTKDGILVLEPTGEWTPLETIFKRGWTLEYLQKRNRQ